MQGAEGRAHLQKLFHSLWACVKAGLIETVYVKWKRQALWYILYLSLLLN